MGKSFNTRHREHPFGGVRDDRRKLIGSGKTAPDETAYDLPGSQFGTHDAPKRLRKAALTSKAFWIGLLVGLVLVGLAFSMA